MALLPRPASPRNALADLLLMFSPDRPHRWSLLGLSVAITGIIIWAFVLDSRKPPTEQQIIYVESWMADRKDSTIIREQIKDLDGYEANLEKQQKGYQRLADSTGIDWRADEAKNRARRVAVIAAIRKSLDKKLAAALAAEAAKPATGQTKPLNATSP